MNEINTSIYVYHLMIIRNIRIYIYIFAADEEKKSQTLYFNKLFEMCMQKLAV